MIFFFYIAATQYYIWKAKRDVKQYYINQSKPIKRCFGLSLICLLGLLCDEDISIIRTIIIILYKKKNNVKINILHCKCILVKHYITMTSEWIITEMSWLTVFLIAKTKSLSVPRIQGGGHSRGRHGHKQQIEVHHDNDREK